MQIAAPAFVSTLCICIVFVPVIFLTGAARYLFTPLALAVVLAMIASYLLSRTLVPTMVRYLLAGEAALPRDEGGDRPTAERLSARFTTASSAGSTACAMATATCWRRAGASRLVIAAASSCSARPAWRSRPFLGEDFFPQVDAGQIRLHVRAPAGTRIEETERYFAQVEDRIRRSFRRRV